MTSSPHARLTPRDVVAAVVVAGVATAFAAFLSSPGSSASAAANPAPTALVFPAWNIDCSPFQAQVSAGPDTATLKYVPYNLQFTSNWIVPKKTPSTGYLNVKGVGERDSKAILRIITAQQQLDWAKKVTDEGWAPDGPQSLAFAATLGSYSTKSVTNDGSVEFRLGWWMFSPRDEQLTFEVKGCKSISNRDDNKTFVQTTLPSAAVTISNISQTVVNVCTNCNTAISFDCEHVFQTAIVVDPAAQLALAGGTATAAQLDNPVSQEAGAILQPPTMPKQQYDRLGRLKPGMTDLFDDASFDWYEKSADQTKSNTGSAMDDAGTLAYYGAGGLAQVLTANEDASFVIAGAQLSSQFSDWYASDPKNQHMNVASGVRGYVVQPTTYLDFNADIRLTCPGAGYCGRSEGDTVVLGVDRATAMQAPLQIMLFIPKDEDDTNADGEVNDLDVRPEICTDTPEKCAYTVTGKLTGFDEGQVILVSGGTDDAYAAKFDDISGGTYTFTGVLPGVWMLKIDQDSAGNPCHFLKMVKVGVNEDGTGWDIKDPPTITVEDADASDACFVSQTRSEG